MEIRNSIILNDSMSPVLDKIVTSLRHTLDLLRSTAGESAMFKQVQKDIMQAQKALQEYNTILENTKAKQNMPPSYTPASQDFSRHLSQFTLPFTETLAKIELLKQGFQAIKSVTSYGDELILNQTRIKLMADGLMDVKDVQDLIFQSAQRSRAEYIATANTVTRLGILAGQAFSFTEGKNKGKLNAGELIKFSELVNKAFVIGGSTAIEQKSAMYQLTQALASGRLQGDELRVIREAAPLLRNSIRDYLGVSEEQFAKMARNGQITADVIKNAVFTSANSIENAFQQMPMTAEQSFIKLQNVFQRVTGNIFMGISSAIASTVEVISNNMNVIILIFGYLTSLSVVTWFRTLSRSLMGVATSAWAMATGFIAAHLPIFLTITAIFALIALFLKFPEALGIAVSGFYFFGAVVYDIIMGLVNVAIFLVNTILQAVNKLNELRGSDTRFETYSYGEFKNPFESAKTGFDVGKNLSITASKELNKLVSPFSNTFKNVEIGLSGNTNFLNKELDVGNVKNVKGGKISLDEDSIKYLNEEGAIDFVNRYTTMNPVLNVQFGDVRETADVNQIADQLITMLQDAQATSLE